MTEPSLTLSRFQPGTLWVVVPLRPLTWAFELTQSVTIDVMKHFINSTIQMFYEIFEF